MSIPGRNRDYSLVGVEGERAREKGLAGARWYRSPVARKQLAELMRRSNGPALRDTAIWLSALVLSGGASVWLWGGWWCVPSLFVYGVLYGSASDSRWHECGHGTAFKTRWLNDAVYQLASFMILREPTVWRWSHVRHHSDTIIVGRDPEIAVPRPPGIACVLLDLLALKSGAVAAKKLLVHATGRLPVEERGFVPEAEHAKVYRIARLRRPKGRP